MENLLEILRNSFFSLDGVYPLDGVIKVPVYFEKPICKYEGVPGVCCNNCDKCEIIFDYNLDIL